MWEIEEVTRAGTTVLIFYKTDPSDTHHDKTLYARGSIVCNEKDEVELWRTVLPILNSTQESEM